MDKYFLYINGECQFEADSFEKIQKDMFFLFFDTFCDEGTKDFNNYANYKVLDNKDFGFKLRSGEHVMFRRQHNKKPLKLVITSMSMQAFTQWETYRLLMRISLQERLEMILTQANAQPAPLPSEEKKSLVQEIIYSVTGELMKDRFLWDVEQSSKDMKWSITKALQYSLEDFRHKFDIYNNYKTRLPIKN